MEPGTFLPKGRTLLRCNMPALTSPAAKMSERKLRLARRSRKPSS